MLAHDANKIMISYFQRLNVKPARNNRQFWNNIKYAFGKEIFDQLNNATTDSLVQDNSNLYVVKNQSLELSLAFQDYSVDLYRQFFGWLATNHNQDPQSILDIGCDNGFATCLLAQMYPNTRIVGIDRCINGINCANQLKAKLGLENVEFVQADVQRLDKVLPDVEFDLIISIRSMHEIGCDAWNENKYWSLSEYADQEVKRQQTTQLHEALNEIYSRITSNGSFVSFERAASASGAYKYVLALERSFFSVKREAMHRLSFIELGEQETFFLVVALKDGQEQENKVRNILELYVESDDLNISVNHEYNDLQAELIFAEIADKELLFGVQYDFLKEDGNKMRVEFWKDKSYGFKYEYSNIGYRKLVVFDKSMLDDVLQKEHLNPSSDRTIRVSKYKNIVERDSMK